jgi:predicted nuclease with TOPRIM domain
MGLFDDILKGLPENAVLRAKVSEAKEENASLKQENAALKDDLRQAKAEIVKLKDEIQRLTHEDTPDEAEVKILTYLAKTGGSALTGDIMRAVDLHTIVVKKSIGTLRERGLIAPTYLRRTHMVTGYKLTQPGLEYTVDNGLISDT